jgi:hypothetical protein
MSVPITRIEQTTPTVKPAMEVEGDVPIILLLSMIVMVEPAIREVEGDVPILLSIVMVEFIERLGVAAIDSELTLRL